ncbi:MULTISPECIES: hypothetical protein [Pirellulaceae]|nr:MULTISPECIES: hypothetical protein [Pirellulaceae]
MLSTCSLDLFSRMWQGSNPKPDRLSTFARITTIRQHMDKKSIEHGARP